MGWKFIFLHPSSGKRRTRGLCSGNLRRQTRAHAFPVSRVALGDCLPKGGLTFSNDETVDGEQNRGNRHFFPPGQGNRREVHEDKSRNEKKIAQNWLCILAFFSPIPISSRSRLRIAYSETMKEEKFRTLK